MYNRTVDAIAEKDTDMNLVCGSKFTESEQYGLLRLPTCGKHPCRKVVFEIEGREQSFHDPPDISNSCYVAIVERFQFDEEREKSLPLALGTSAPQRRGTFRPRESEPTIVAPSMYDCQNIAQKIIWRYNEKDEMLPSHSLGSLPNSRRSSNGRDFIKGLEVTDRLSLRLLMTNTPDNQPYISINGLVKVKVYWAI